MRLLTFATLILLTACKGSPKTDSPVVASEPKNTEWGNEEAIALVGYSANAMEPKLSADEQYLFFNNKTGDDTQMDIHYATRISATKYQYQGVLPGSSVGGFLDGVPAIDSNLNFYFISTRSYGTDFVTVYGGTFNPGNPTGSLTGVSEKGQAFTAAQAGKIIMDVDVTWDGNFLVLSRAEFNGGPVPAASDLDLAVKSGGSFVSVPQAAQLFSKVNTTQYLEYAGTLSADGLELYFTRALDSSSDTSLRVMVSKRATSSENFGSPLEVAAISGTATEAPHLTVDGKHLYFHKKVGGAFGIYRVSR